MSKFFSQSTEKALEARAENSDDSLDTWNVKKLQYFGADKVETLNLKYPFLWKISYLNFWALQLYLSCPIFKQFC